MLGNVVTAIDCTSPALSRQDRLNPATTQVTFKTRLVSPKSSHNRWLCVHQTDAPVIYTGEARDRPQCAMPGKPEGAFVLQLLGFIIWSTWVCQRCAWAVLTVVPGDFSRSIFILSHIILQITSIQQAYHNHRFESENTAPFLAKFTLLVIKVKRIPLSRS